MHRWDTGGFRRVFYIAVTLKWDTDAVAVAFYRARMQIRDASPRKFVRSPETECYR